MRDKGERPYERRVYRHPKWGNSGHVNEFIILTPKRTGTMRLLLKTEVRDYVIK